MSALARPIYRQLMGLHSLTLLLIVLPLPAVAKTRPPRAPAFASSADADKKTPTTAKRTVAKTATGAKTATDAKTATGAKTTTAAKTASASTSAQPVVATKLVRHTHRPTQSHFFDLRAQMGYGGYFDWKNRLGLHGPVVSMAAVYSWTSAPKLGVRVAGHFSPMWAEKINRDAEGIGGNSFGVTAGAQATMRNGLWVAFSLGFFHFENGNADETLNALETVFSGGYDLELGKALSLMLSGEVAYGGILTGIAGRAQAQIGLLVRL
jgi:hypothetical protein